MSPRVRKVLRWTRRIVMAVLAAALLALAIVLIVLHTDFGRDQLRKRAENSLASTFPGGAKIGRVEGSVLGTLTAYDIELDTVDGKPMIKIDRLDFDIALRALASHVVRVEHAVATGVLVRITDAKLSNEPPEPAGDGAPSPWNLELPAVEVHRGTLEIARGTTRLAFDDIELVGAVSKPSGEPLAAGFDELHGTWRERHAPIVGSGSVRVENVVELPRLDLRVGGVHVDAQNIAIDVGAPRGTATITAPASAVAALVPEIQLPADANVTVVADGGGARIDGKLGAAEIHGIATGSALERRGSAIIRIDGIDAHMLDPTIDSRGSATVIASYDERSLEKPMRAMVHARGSWADMPDAYASVSIAGTPTKLAAMFGVTSEGQLRADGSATIVGRDGTYALESSKLSANVADLSTLTRKRIAVTGATGIELEASGTLTPKLELVAFGHVQGRRVTYDTNLTAGTLEADVDARIEKGLAVAMLRGDLGGVYQDTTPLGSVHVEAANCDRERMLVARFGGPQVVTRAGCDRQIIASAVAHPAAAPSVVAQVNAVLTPNTSGGPRLLDIALGSHRIALPNGEVWSGSGGQVAIDARLVVVKVPVKGAPAPSDTYVKLTGLRSKNHDATVDVVADYSTLQKTLTATIDANALAASSIDPTYAGTASGKIQLKRRGIRWDGTAKLVAKGLAFDPAAPPFDGDVDLVVAGRTVTVDAHATSTAVGRARVELDIEGPPDLTDGAAWKALDRSALRSATITATHIDLAGAAVPTGGIVDGQLTIAGKGTKGAMSVQGVHTVLGDAKGNVSFEPMGDNLRGSTNADIEGLGTASIVAEIRFPQRPFDPAAWKWLGRRMLDKLIVSIDDVEVTPQRLAALGIRAPYKGRADISFNIVSGTSTANFEVDVRDISGGVLVRPLAVHAEGRADSGGTHAELEVLLPPEQKQFAGDMSVTVASAIADVPVRFSDWMADPVAALNSHVSGTVSLGTPSNPQLAAPTLLAVFGRRDVIGGIVTGKVIVGGTLRTPVAHADIAATNVSVAPTVSGSTPKLDNLVVTADWGGVSGWIHVEGKAGPGTLTAHVNGRLDQLASADGRLDVKDFQLASLSAFLPGKYASTTGILKANLTAHGLDRYGTVRGDLHVTDGSMQLSALLGTLRDATADLTIDPDGKYHVVARGVVGAGSGFVALDATAPRDVAALDATIDLQDVTLINDLQPILNAKVIAKLKRDGTTFIGTAHVTHRDTEDRAKLTIPENEGDELLDEDAPDDLYFVDEGVPDLVRFREEEKPWLIVDVDFDDVEVHAGTDLTRAEVRVDANVYGQLHVALGDLLDTQGYVGLHYGTATIFGRDYAIGRVRNLALFTGTLNPILDVELEHEFAAAGFTMNVKIGDRLKVAKPTFTAIGTNYTQGQLLAFFLGSEPSGDANAATGDAAKSASVSLVTSALGRRLQKRLPFPKIGGVSLLPDFQCKTGSSTGATGSSGSCTFTYRLNSRVSVGYLARTAPTKDENTGDVMLQYYFLKNWFLEGVGGDRGHDGLDILWRHRW